MSEVDPDEFLATLAKYSIIGSDQRILGPSPEIWNEISRVFANNICAKYAYILVKCNRYNLLDKYLSIKQIIPENNDDYISEESNDSFDIPR